MKKIINKLNRFFSDLTALRFSTKNILLMRFVIGNFLIIFFAILILSVFSTTKTIQIISQNTDEFANNQIKTITSNADYALNDIYKIISSFTTTKNEGNTLFSFNSWKSEDKSSLDFFNWITSLRSYINNYEFLNKVIVYNGTSIIDTNSGIHSPSTYSQWQEISTLINTAKENYNGYSPYISEVHPADYTENTDYTKNVVSFVAPLISTNTDFSYGAIILNVDLSYLSEKLGNNRISSEHMLFIYDRNYGIIVEPNHKYDKQTILNTLQSYISDPQDTYKINKTSYSILMQNSNAARNWTYFMLYDNTKDIAKKHSIIMLYIIVLIFIILAGFISVWLISSNVYKPLNNIIANLNSQIISHTGNNAIPMMDHANIISTHIDTLQTELNKKMQFISNNMPEIRKITIANILDSTQYLTNEEIKTSLAKCEIMFNDKFYYVALLSIDDYWKMLSTTSTKHIDNNLNSAFTVIYNTLSQNINAVGIPTKNNKYATIINTSEPLEDSDIIMLLKKINSALSDKYGYTASMCISEHTTSADNLSRLYDQVVSQEKHRFILGHEALIICPYNKYYENKDVYTVTKYENRIIHSMSQNNTEQIIIDTENFLQLIRSSDPSYIQRYLMNLFDNIEKTYGANAIGYDFNIIYNQLKNFFAYASLKEVFEWITSTIVQLSSVCNDAEQHTTPQKIKDYVNMNFYKDISLDLLAEEFNLSSAYISRLFVENFKVGFQNYLSDLRVDKAKTLLKETDLSIQQISEQCGFVNYNTFSRTFKKYTGVSAKEYRATAHKNPDQKL